MRGGIPLVTVERALAGGWIVRVARGDEGELVGMGRLISDGAVAATEMIVTRSSVPSEDPTGTAHGPAAPERDGAG